MKKRIILTSTLLLGTLVLASCDNSGFNKPAVNVAKYKNEVTFEVYKENIQATEANFSYSFDEGYKITYTKVREEKDTIKYAGKTFVDLEETVYTQTKIYDKTNNYYSDVTKDTGHYSGYNGEVTLENNNDVFYYDYADNHYSANNLDKEYGPISYDAISSFTTADKATLFDNIAAIAVSSLLGVSFTYYVDGDVYTTVYTYNEINYVEQFNFAKNKFTYTKTSEEIKTETSDSTATVKSSRDYKETVKEQKVFAFGSQTLKKFDESKYTVR